ncbi:hypothetical protein GCM10020367_31630 [Streptomyces sannanensis]|uniref:histidine kinase n=1 Tax=Streptomyces sannanensis TaxID=285536 RepID=A0ABP6SC22_9ACTN
MSSRPSRGAARLAAILDALPDGLLLVNCNGTVVNANTIALEMFETPGTALVGRGLLDLLPEFDSTLIPGSMRRPEKGDKGERAKSDRMVARRTDGSEFPAGVTSANLEDGRDAYNDRLSYTGDELLMLVVRDLSGTVDTEAELARSQRQTEMILRAASEGVVGTDTEGRVVLVNPAAAQILGHRASGLGGKELHPLILHTRADGEPFPFEESPLADTLKSGRKHRVRGQVLWTKSGAKVPVDVTTAPVRDGEQLVGAVMTFTDRRPYEEQAAKHAEALERETARYDAQAAKHAEVLERETNRYDELAARHAQLIAVLGGSLRGPLEALRGELATLAADDAGQLWPEANRTLHHLAAGYARMTTLVDNVLAFQRLDSGTEELKKDKVLLDAVVAAAVDGAVELIGPGRAQFAVHAPAIEAEVDAGRLATALAHLIADVAGVDATGNAPVIALGGGYMDSTVVVAAAQRGDVARIEVRGPYAGGDPVHQPIVRGIVEAHDGVLQTHSVPGMSGNAYVLEVPLGTGAGTVTAPAVEERPAERAVPALPAQQTSDTTIGGGRRRARRASTDAFLESSLSPETSSEGRTPTGRRRAGRSDTDGVGIHERIPAQQGAGADAVPSGGGTGRRRGRPSPAEEAPAEGAVVTAAESARDTGRPALGTTVPPQGMPVEAAQSGTTGRRARQAPEQSALPALPAAPQALPAAAAQPVPSGPQGLRTTKQPPMPAPVAPESPDGRGAGAYNGAGQAGSHRGTGDGVAGHPADAASAEATQPAPVGRRARRALASAPAEAASADAAGARTAFALPPATADRVPPTAGETDASLPGRHDAVAAGRTPSLPHPQTISSTGAVPLPPAVPVGDADSTQGRAISVRTLGQGVPFGQQIAQQGSGSGGRRRKLATPPDSERRPEPSARPHPQPQPLLDPPSEGRGRAYAIGAPDEGVEGPQPLDGPGGAVEVKNRPVPQPVDDELPPEPLDNPRRLLVWPAPDPSTQQALGERGYRPVVVHSREEVDAQIAASPAALFVDPLTGPITRKALQSLREAAVAAEVPVLVTAGLGQATREAAYGADPAVLLKALAPRDSEQHPPRVLLLEEHEEIALALTATLERRGLQVARAGSDDDAVTLATQMRPNLVVMDLMLVRRRRAGIVDWLRANGRLNHTPLVVYTSAGIDQAELPRLASGETVLFLAERSTNAEVQGRIVDLLARIGTN